MSAAPGTATHPRADSSTPRMQRPTRAVIAGVAAGLADHLGWSVSLVRIGFVFFALAGGGGLLFYLWLWALTPLAGAPNSDADAQAGEDASARRSFPVAPVLVALAAVAAVVTIALAAAGAFSGFTGGTAFFALLTVALAGGAVAWSLQFDRRDPGRSARYGVITRTLAAVGLALTGLVLLALRPQVETTVLALVMIVGATAVLGAPVVVRLWTSLLAERAARVREESRAEVAAHLHDSVLQTLALIQNRAGASSEVARIARAQERELRDWLFAGTRPSGADFAAQLREAAVAIELEYAVRFDVVTTGDFTGRSFPWVLAAAREAMLNAARHAGGEVSVYVELSATTLDVYVRDRGPGFDPDRVPDGRLGVRESIIGRMQRHGGTATVTSSDTGAQVHLHTAIETTADTTDGIGPQAASSAPETPAASMTDASTSPQGVR